MSLRLVLGPQCNVPRATKLEMERQERAACKQRNETEVLGLAWGRHEGIVTEEHLCTLQPADLQQLLDDHSPVYAGQILEVQGHIEELEAIQANGMTLTPTNTRNLQRLTSDLARMRQHPEQLHQAVVAEQIGRIVGTIHDAVRIGCKMVRH